MREESEVAQCAGDFRGELPTKFADATPEWGEEPTAASAVDRL